MAIKTEFAAEGRDEQGVAEFIGADSACYMTCKGLDNVAQKVGLKNYCSACFDGKYPTGLTPEDITRIEDERLGDKGLSC